MELDTFRSLNFTGFRRGSGSLGLNDVRKIAKKFDKEMAKKFDESKGVVALSVWTLGAVLLHIIYIFIYCEC